MNVNRIGRQGSAPPKKLPNLKGFEYIYSDSDEKPGDLYLFDNQNYKPDMILKEGLTDWSNIGLKILYEEVSLVGTLAPKYSNSYNIELDMGILLDPQASLIRRNIDSVNATGGDPINIGRYNFTQDSVFNMGYPEVTKLFFTTSFFDLIDFTYTVKGKYIASY